MNYDANLFCEIIESEGTVEFLREENIDGFIIRYYQGTKGFIAIDYDDENFTDNTGKGYLKQLGLEHRIPAMYPEEIKPNELLKPFNNENYNSEIDCNACNGIGQLEDNNSLVASCHICNGSGIKPAVNNTVD